VDATILQVSQAPSHQGKFSGWVFYDAHCGLCVRLAQRAQGFLLRKGLRLVPLQTEGLTTALGLSQTELMKEMRLLTADGRLLGGVDAALEIFRDVVWAWPLFLLARLPGGQRLLRWSYARLAANRYCISGVCSLSPRPVVAEPPVRQAQGGPCAKARGGPIAVRAHHEPAVTAVAWLPLVLGPLSVFLARPFLPAWVFMWLLAFAIWAGCKWLTFQQARVEGHVFPGWRTLSYLCAWVGMDAAAFALDPRAAEASNLANCSATNVAAPAQERSPIPLTPAATMARPWLEAGAVTLAGVALLWGAARFFSDSPLLVGWIGMVGVIATLHFGSFRLLALGWRRLGLRVSPVMRQPWRSSSVGDFWGRRWNTGFHTLAHQFLFLPVKNWSRRRGQSRVSVASAAALATVGTFLVSGLIHDLVITVPAGGGYGLPTAYFLWQGIALLFERSTAGQALGLGHGWRGRAFTLFVTAGPAFWLFPPVFVHRVILPMLTAIGAV
jgi:alginate O-acetyltransferase complex protein AlgI